MTFHERTGVVPGEAGSDETKTVRQLHPGG